jgi:CFEM domain
VNYGLNTQTLCTSNDLTCICNDSTLGYDIGYCLGSTCDDVDMNASMAWLQNLCLGEMAGERPHEETVVLIASVRCTKRKFPDRNSASPFHRSVCRYHRDRYRRIHRVLRVETQERRPHHRRKSRHSNRCYPSRDFNRGRPISILP